MRQQAGLFKDADRHCSDIGQGVCIARLIEPLPRNGPPVLGSIPQREERLGASEVPTAPSDLHHLVG